MIRSVPAALCSILTYSRFTFVLVVSGACLTSALELRSSLRPEPLSTGCFDQSPSTRLPIRIRRELFQTKTYRKGNCGAWGLLFVLNARSVAKLVQVDPNSAETLECGRPKRDNRLKQPRSLDHESTWHRSPRNRRASTACEVAHFRTPSNSVARVRPHPSIILTQ